MSSYKLTLYKATEDSSTSDYADILESTISGFAGFNSLDCEIRLVQEADKLEGENVEYLGGEKSSNTDYRRTYNPIFKQFTYAGSSWDISDMNNITRNFFTSDFLWLGLASWESITAPAENYHSSGKVIPIVLTEYGIESDEKAGLKTLTATFEHRFKGI